MEDTTNVYEVFFDSIHGGTRHSYFKAESQAEVEESLGSRKNSIINYMGKVSIYATEDDIRRKFGLSSDAEFLY